MVAEKGALRSETVRAHEGDRGVLLVLSSHWTLSGRLLVDPGVDPGRIALSLEDADQKPVDADVRNLSDDGLFAFEQIPPGVYDLVCALEGHRLTELEGVLVTEDTDVGTIDLRGEVDLREIILLGALEPDAITGEIAWRPSGSEDDWSGRHFRGSSVELVTPIAPVDVWVRPNAYRHALLREVTGRRELHLNAPLRVRIKLHTNGQLPELPYLLRPDLKQDGVRVGQPEGPQFLTDENREVGFLVSVPGSIRVHWHLIRQLEPFGTRSSNRLVEQEVEIEVLDVAGEQVFTVDLDGEALASLMTKPPW